MNVSEPPRARKDLRALAELPPAFAKFLGIEITEITLDRVVARLTIRAELGNRNDVAAGGVLMALADHLGGSAAFANLPPGARTTTIESKTNFFAAIPLGDTAMAECLPLHRGRTTMVWETRITRGDGRLAAVVTQTQLVMLKGS